MPVTTTRVSPDVRRMLEAGQTSRFDENSGVLRTLHANCPDDGTRASVRRMSRELGGAIMEVTMRCPACFRDFTAAPETLYLSGRTSRSSAATKAPTPAATTSAATTPAKTAAKAPTTKATKAASKTPVKAAAKAARTPIKTATKTSTKSAAKTGAKSAGTTSGKAAAKTATKSVGGNATKAAKKTTTKGATKARGASKSR